MNKTARFLTGLRVLELSSSTKGAYCGRLLASLGSEVVKIEPPEGDSLRHHGPYFYDKPGLERSIPFAHYNSGKKGITLDLKGESAKITIREMVNQFDVLLVDISHKESSKLGLSYDMFSEVNPRLIVTLLTDFGSGGPYSDYLAPDLIAQSISGMMSLTGRSHKKPIGFGVELTQIFTGAITTGAILCALYEREQSGQGQQVDINMFECTLQSMFQQLIQYGYLGAISGRPSKTPRGDFMDSMLKTNNGYFMPFFYGYFDWSLVVALLDDPRLADERFYSYAGRVEHMSELLPIMNEALITRSKLELFEESQRLGLPFGMVQNVEDLLSCKQLAKRNYWTTVKHPVVGEYKSLGGPFICDGSRYFIENPAPMIGQHNDEVYGKLSDRRVDAQSSIRNPRSNLGEAPLCGIRVLDLGQVWAAPLVGRLMALLGAEVIKIESPHRPDTVRFGDYPDNQISESYWETSGRYHHFSLNKKSLCVDLTTDSGKNIVKQLMKKSDIVLENFKPGVMDKLGFGYSQLKEVNPDIIMISASGYGASGPRREYRSYGPSLQAMIGLSSVTGYGGSEPCPTALQYVDTHAGVFCFIAALAALYRKQQTGQGQWIDMSQYEAGIEAMAIPLIDFIVNGKVTGTSGNRTENAAPSGCYPCKGDNKWLTLAILSDDQWIKLREVMGNPLWSKDSRFNTAEMRRSHQDELDAQIAEWTKNQECRDAMARLQAFGVPAGAVLNNKDLYLDEQLRFLDVFHRVDFSSKSGMENVKTRLHQGFPAKFSRTPSIKPEAAPGLGEHNMQILSEMLGLNAEEIDVLESSGVIATKPVGTEPSGAIQTTPLDIQKKQGIIRDYDADFRQILGLNGEPAIQLVKSGDLNSS